MKKPSRYFKVFYSYNLTSDYYGLTSGTGTIGVGHKDGSFFNPKTTLDYLDTSECSVTVEGVKQEAIYSNWRIDKIEELTESEFRNMPKGNVEKKNII